MQSECIMQQQVLSMKGGSDSFGGRQQEVLNPRLSTSLSCHLAALMASMQNPSSAMEDPNCPGLRRSRLAINNNYARPFVRAWCMDRGIKRLAALRVIDFWQKRCGGILRL